MIDHLYFVDSDLTLDNVTTRIHITNIIKLLIVGVGQGTRTGIGQNNRNNLQIVLYKLVGFCKL